MHSFYMPCIHSNSTVSQSLKFLVTSICDLSDVINCQFHECAEHFWDPCIFCCRTNSLEFTAWSFPWASCWLRTI